MSISIDGFVGGPNGEIDWIFKSMDEGAAAWIVDTLWQAGTHIMGSRTFRAMVAYWPTSTENFAQPMNEIPKAYFTRGAIGRDGDLTTTALKDAIRARTAPPIPIRTESLPNGAAWNEARICSGELTEELARLKSEPGKDILAHGGASFAQSLAALGLIDEYRLLVHPVALGNGLPLFAKIPSALHLKLLNTIPFASGAVANIYVPKSAV